MVAHSYVLVVVARVIRHVKGLTRPEPTHKRNLVVLMSKARHNKYLSQASLKITIRKNIPIIQYGCQINK